MGEPLVRLRSAAFGYQGRPVVAGVDLDVEAGSFVGVLGPNGSGKTTLVRGILGLLPPLAGRVEARTGAFGYVPQREALDPVFPVTVAEVVEMGAYGRLRGWGRPSRADRALVGESLERVGLAPRRRELFAALSGGQRQRALIARALVMRPRVLLLDEPTSGVDAPTQRTILDLLARLNREDGLAILLVSHQLGAMREVAREVLWVADGEVRRRSVDELATPEALAGLFAGEG